MAENIEETVLMKCEHCGYEEEVPLNTLELLKDLRSEDGVDKLLCPFCLYYMFRKKDTKN